MSSWIFGFNFTIKDCPEFGFILNRRPRLLHPAMLWSAGDVKEHTRLSLREGQEVSGVVVWSLLFKWGLGWEMLGDMSYHKGTLQSEGKLSIHIHNIHMSCHVISCDAISCHVMSCHIMYVTSCHVISKRVMQLLFFLYPGRRTHAPRGRLHNPWHPACSWSAAVLLRVWSSGPFDWYFPWTSSNFKRILLL